jgi:hypothetical protein
LYIYIYTHTHKKMLNVVTLLPHNCFPFVDYLDDGEVQAL